MSTSIVPNKTKYTLSKQFTSLYGYSFNAAVTLRVNTPVNEILTVIGYTLFGNTLF